MLHESVLIQTSNQASVSTSGEPEFLKKCYPTTTQSVINETIVVDDDQSSDAYAKLTHDVIGKKLELFFRSRDSLQPDTPYVFL